MKRCSVVIGSMWGDEGKGHMTDILCSKDNNTLNVRFNGGAQASHTVVTPDNKRHAFRHFGAGTFAGARTYLSEDFIVNPIAFVLEKDELIQTFGISPYVYVNLNCIVTTPWDIFINQAVEEMRGNNRHGSCGFGINETVVRNRTDKYKLTVTDLFYEDKLSEKLQVIQNEYVEWRLRTEYGLGIEDLPDDYREALCNSENIDMFLFYIQEFMANVHLVGDSVLRLYDNVVFEGAQGLLLDQNNKAYLPHVTTSNTGIKNVMKILRNIGFDGDVDIYYMSRCYLTKHGAGPFKNELGRVPYRNVVDLTNVPNEFQGALRFGYLDFDLLATEINKDLENLSVSANVYITFTCLDQVDKQVIYFENGEQKSVKDSEFLDIAWKSFNGRLKKLNGLYATVGLTRENFISYELKNVTSV